MATLFPVDGVLRSSTLEVIPGVFQITFRAVNVFLIVEEELTLIDTGFRRGVVKIVEFVRSLGRSPEEIGLIIITHNHFDHIGGLPELRKLTGAKVAAHQADLAGLEGIAPYPHVVQKTLHLRPFSALRSVFEADSNEVDIKLEGGEVLKPLGGLRVIPTPGHTPGSISLFSPKHKLLIVGDALAKRGNDVLPPHKMVTTDLKQATDSIKELSRLDFDILCFGHGRPIIGGAGARLRELAAEIRE